jgi:arsenate reductase
MSFGSAAVDESARLLRVVSDPTRARILASIMASDRGRVLVGDLARELDLTQPTVSHHMKALADEGLVAREPEGRVVWYSIRPADVDRISELLEPTEGLEVTDAVLDRITSDLAVRFSGTFSKQTVRRYVRESHELLSESSTGARHLSSRTALFAADRLAAVASEREGSSSGPTEVLFVCVQNAGRSQIAAALMKQLAGDRVNVRTAGSAPAGGIRAVVTSALDEVGVPLAGEYPKPLTDEVVRAADVVVTMGCGDACPIYPGRRYLDWELADPVGQPIERVREIRDEIEAQVRGLLTTLGAD